MASESTFAGFDEGVGTGDLPYAERKYIPPPIETLPADFFHGFSTAAFQCEGGWDADGKGPSVWDDVCHNPRPPNFVFRNNENGDTGMDSYHKYKDDVALLKSYGCNAYRFSISWPRVIPRGGRDDPINQAGLQYYSDLVDECLKNGITPFPTLYHWDLPLPLEQKYEGWSNGKEIVADFVRFADVMFEALGDRVKYWLTINEPWNVVNLNSWLKPTFDAQRDTFLVGHNLILAHAHTVDLYRRKYQKTQGGQISIVHVSYGVRPTVTDIKSCDWAEPIDDSEPAKAGAAKRMDFSFHWFADPIYLGEYPQTMIDSLGARLPKFTEEEIKLVKGSADMFALNSYSAMYATGGTNDFEAGGCADTTFWDKDGKPIGSQRASFNWLWDTPWAFRKLLVHVHKRYTKPTGQAIYITENGFPTNGENHRRFPDLLRDTERQNYFDGYLEQLSEAVVKDGVDIRGYLGWSLLETVEWYCGFGPRLGVTYVDRENGFTRHPKDSAFVIKAWFESAIKKA